MIELLDPLPIEGTLWTVREMERNKVRALEQRLDRLCSEKNYRLPEPLRLTKDEVWKAMSLDDEKFEWEMEGKVLGLWEKILCTNNVGPERWEREPCEAEKEIRRFINRPYPEKEPDEVIKAREAKIKAEERAKAEAAAKKEAEERAAIEQSRKRREAKEARERAIKEAGEHGELDPEQYPDPDMLEIDLFAESFHGNGKRSLWLRGPTGSGKTFMARKILIDYAIYYYKRNGHQIHCFSGKSFRAFLGKVGKGHRESVEIWEEIIDGWASVFIDDLSHAKPDEIMVDGFFDLMDAVDKKGIHLFVTCYHPPEKVLQIWEKKSPDQIDAIAAIRRRVRERTDAWEFERRAEPEDQA